MSLDTAENYREHCSNFLRDIIRIPSTSTHEEKVVARIGEEMRKLNFDKVWSDDFGNVIGQVGTGPIRIVYDSHIDTVGVGNKANWPYDPFEGKIEDGTIYGRGASDNKAATAVEVYGAALFKKLGKHLDEVSVFVLGAIQEEDCDGLGCGHALDKSIGKVDYVCLGECTDLAIYRGHRGRMEIKVRAKGRSCHGSAPERGDNAIYKMTRLVADIEKLNERLKHDSFLGKGTCAVTHISCDTPSLCAVPDGCEIHIDRRLTHGENKELALQEIRDLPSFDSKSMDIRLNMYSTPSYKGKVLETECYFPTWVLPEEHELVQAGVKAATEVLGKKPVVDKWVFSTNGVSSMGKLGIPTIGFGPAREEDSHTTKDRVKIDDLVTSVAFYAALPEAILNARK